MSYAIREALAAFRRWRDVAKVNAEGPYDKEGARAKAAGKAMAYDDCIQTLEAILRDQGETP
jgi:hypothetical protein